MSDDAEWLEQFTQELGLDSFSEPVVNFLGYVSSFPRKDQTYLGMTQGHWPKDPESPRTADVMINVRVLRCSKFGQKAVLWHEMCHAADWVHNQNMSHGPSWMALMKKHPLLFLGTVTTVFEYIAHNLR